MTSVLIQVKVTIIKCQHQLEKYDVYINVRTYGNETSETDTQHSASKIRLETRNVICIFDLIIHIL